MLLIECFHPVLLLVEQLPTRELRSSSPGDMEKQFVEAFGMAERDASEAHHSSAQIEAAKFSYAVLIDELLMSSDTEFAAEWKQHLLQERFFGTRTGGDRVFSEMSKVLEPLAQNYDIQLIYLSCLDSGLVAALHKDLTSIDEVKHRIRESVQLLRRARASDRVLCPSAYRGLGQRGTVNRASRRGGLITTNIVGVLVVVALFAYYSASIKQVVDSTATHGVLESGLADSGNAEPVGGFGALLGAASSRVGGLVGDD